MKTRWAVRPGILAIRFDEQSFFATILGFAPHWDYKHYNKYFTQNILNLSTTNRIHLKCDEIDGSVVNGLRQLTFYSFVVNKKPGFKVFCNPETVHYKKSRQKCFEYYNFLFRKWKSQRSSF